jgi:hypothetical protein
VTYLNNVHFLRVAKWRVIGCPMAHAAALHGSTSNDGPQHDGRVRVIESLATKEWVLFSKVLPELLQPGTVAEKTIKKIRRHASMLNLRLKVFCSPRLRSERFFTPLTTQYQSRTDI